MTSPTNRKTGVWIIGALGDLASTLRAGTYAICEGMASTTGIVTELTPMDGLDLVSMEDLVFGGIDIRKGSVHDATMTVYRQSRTFSHELLDAIAPHLTAAEDDLVIDPALFWDIQPLDPDQPTLSETVERIRGYLRRFITRHKLSHVVVANLASAEALPVRSPLHSTLEGLEELLATNRKDLVPPSMCYAYAAFLEGCSHINFSSSEGAAIGALQELAARRGLPHYGQDGKTGETLVKTVLAPMFALRNLRVMSWEGINMLGNNDGKTLDDPEKRKAKLQHKSDVLPKILGYPLHSGVNINYVPSLGDWKTAWDLIHFRGFLDVPMTMQFTWQGCDSILAAPLVLDVVRLSELAAACGETGPMKHLACFFKSPLGVAEMSFAPQFDMLLEYTYRHLQRKDKDEKLSCAG